MHVRLEGDVGRCGPIALLHFAGARDEGVTPWMARQMRQAWKGLVRRGRGARVAARIAWAAAWVALWTQHAAAAARDRAVSSATFDALYQAVRDYVNLFLGFVGIVAVAMMIYGGVVMMTSGTNERKYESGKQVLIKAGIGAVIAWSAYYFAGLLKGFADKL
ncbi:hypothetical protein JCM13210_03550 [Thermaerobacter litoralis]